MSRSVPRNQGTRVPRNTHWSWSSLVREYGEEHALLMLQKMPGLGQYEEHAYVRSIDHGTWSPTSRWRGPYAPVLDDERYIGHTPEMGYVPVALRWREMPDDDPRPPWVGMTFPKGATK